jgi:arylsulfatase A-like enzyme
MNQKLSRTLILTFLLGALVGTLEGIGVMSLLELNFRAPALEVFGVQWRYGLLCLACLPIAFLMAKLLRLPRQTATDLASWSGLGFAWIISNWWIQGEVLRNISITSPWSLTVLALTTALVFILHWAIRRLARVRPNAAKFSLIGALLILPLAGQILFQRIVHPPEVPANAAELPDITLVVIDTLRADHLGTYGYKRADGDQTSPIIDDLATQGVVFENCWSQAPWTRPSMASLHSGLYCSGHSVNEKFDMLPEEVVSMAEMAHDSGYRTAGFSANANVSVTYGFDQGFEKLWTVGKPRTLATLTRWGELQHIVINKMLNGNVFDGSDDARLVNAQAFDWIDSIADDPRPKFTYVHYIDPHTPYTPPEGGWYFSGQLENIEGLEDYVKDRGKLQEFPFQSYPDPGPEIIAKLIRNYDAEIRFVDTELGKLVEKLRAAGQLEDEDWLFITSDHGEEFYDHGHWGHGQSMFEEQIHVPLIVLGPAAPDGLRQVQEVNLLDLHATIGELVQYQGEHASPSLSVIPLLDGLDHPDQRRILYSERLQGSKPLAAVRQNNRKLIESPDMEARGDDDSATDVINLWFDLNTNPGELTAFDLAVMLRGGEIDRDVPSLDPPQDLTKLLKAMQARKLIGAVEGQIGQASAAEKNALIEMGYLDKDGNLIMGGGH